MDLSYGTLGNASAEGLLAGQSLIHVESLSLRHHYMTPGVAQRVVDALPATHVDVAEPRTETNGTRFSWSSVEPVYEAEHLRWIKDRKSVRTGYWPAHIIP